MGARFPAERAQRGLHTRRARRPASKHRALDSRHRPARVRADSKVPKGTWPAGARASNGPTAISKQRWSAPGRGISQPPADQYGSAPQRRPVQAQQAPATAGNPAGAGSDRSQGSQPSRLTNTGVRHRRASGSTDPRNSARSVPAPSARTKQGANRTTGVRYRESAQHRPIASIGRMRGTFLRTIRPLAPIVGVMACAA